MTASAPRRLVSWCQTSSASQPRRSRTMWKQSWSQLLPGKTRIANFIGGSAILSETPERGPPGTAAASGTVRERGCVGDRVSGVAQRVGVLARRAGLEVGDGERVGDVGRGRRKDPVAPVDDAAVEHLDEQLEVVR